MPFTPPYAHRAQALRRGAAVPWPMGGATGPQGPPGPSGPAGPPGDPGQSFTTFEYMFDTGTTEPATSANIRFDSATYTAVTKVWVNEIDSVGRNNANAFTLVDAGTRLFIQDKDDATKWVSFDVTAPGIDKGVYWEFPVTWHASGPSPLAAQRVLLNIAVMGTPGVQILTGTGPPTAVTGVNGDYYIDTDTDTMYGPKLATGQPGGPEFVCTLANPNGDTASLLSEGLTFTVSRACWLVGVNHWIYPGDETTPWWFQLWNMAGSATVPLYRKQTSGGLVAGAWAREPLGPYELQPGITYMLSVTNTAGGRSYVGPLGAPTNGPLSILAGGYYNSNANLDSRPAASWGDYGPATSPVVQDPDPALLWPVAMQGGVGAYRHVQATAATVWSIAHNLSFRPNVSAVDSTGREVWPGAVDYPSATTVTLTFSAAVGGEAYLS
jgi:hypothetical protein